MGLQLGIDHAAIRKQVVGLETQVPLLDGSNRPAINFDNAASTPVLRPVLDTVVEFMSWYSSVHRGAGFKSQIATHAYEDARRTVGKFFGACPDQHVVIFGKNSTEAINKLSRRIAFRPDDVVLCSLVEHHSNDLPWRSVANVVHIDIDADGRLDERHYARLLREYRGRVRLVAVNGGSNVTGYIAPVHRFAEQAHAVGAEILVDCAQLAPHRPIDIGGLVDPAHLDYIVISGHKLYAPFGSGALIGRRDTFSRGAPDYVGGGTVAKVTPAAVTWAATPDRDEAGTPNVVGAVALARALEVLQTIGMEQIAAHEAELTSYALERLASITGLHLYGETNPDRSDERLGVLTFSIAGVPNMKVAAILSAEFGISVRSGSFCAQPYVSRLLGLEDGTLECGPSEVPVGDRTGKDGLTRISFGIYNTIEEVDELVRALETIAAESYDGDYVLDRSTGDYAPRSWQPDLQRYFGIGKGYRAVLEDGQNEPAFETV